MAKCKICKTIIPDGTEYCKDCLDKDSTKINESYLDSLLNSVINTTPSSGSTYKKNNGNTNNNNSVNNEKIGKTGKTETYSKVSDELDQDAESIYSYDIDSNDIDDFSQFNMNDDLDNDIIISDEDLFGKKLDDIFMEQPAVTENIVNTDEMYTEEQKKHESEEEIRKDESVQVTEIPAATVENNVDMQQSNINPTEIANYDEEDSLDPYLKELLSENDELSETETKEQINIAEEHLPLHEGLEKANLNQIDDLEQEEFKENSDEDDILSLLNQISPNDPVSEDVQAISKLLNKTAKPEQENMTMPSSVGEVFSDALKVVSSLDDPDIDEINLLERLSDKNLKNSGKKAKKKKIKKEKITKEKKKPAKNKDTSNEKTISEKGIIKRIFGNVQDDTLKKVKPVKQQPIEEEIAATKGTVKKGKNKTNKNKKVAVTDDKEEALENEKPGKGKKVVTAQDKKDKKEKKKKNKEIMQVIDEIDEDEGRINRIGATIVFLFFGLLVMLLLIGTNIFSYSLSINNATNYFAKQKYTQAYNEVYGIDIKDEDIQVYDRIMTVMFVNKQLNSYNNYYSIGKYPEALDSLLLGLSRYDKYLELATILGVKQDLEYVRDQILAELNNVFNITEADALQIINSDSQTQYSLQVYNVVLEKMNN